MTAHISETIREAAGLWAIRVQARDFTDWDGLTDWLEADPAHLAAYDVVVEADLWAVDAFAARSSPPPIVPAAPSPVPIRQRSWLRTGMAASVIALAGVGSWVLLDRNGAQEIRTAAGERRVVALDDGSRVTLNGGTVLLVRSDRPRDVTLASGEALFDVRHDNDHPFIVHVGDTKLTDVGTVFNVVAQDGALDVAVASGAVIYGADRREVRLDAGQALSRAARDAPTMLRKAEPDSVGTWRTGYLQYADAPLSRVAADIARNIGSPIAVDPGVATLRYSGTVTLAATAEETLARIGPLLAVRIVPAAPGWRMVPIDGARR